MLRDVTGPGDCAALTLLDLSAAFDTVDHTTPVRRLQISYGFNDIVVVLSWFLSARRCASAGLCDSNVSVCLSRAGIVSKRRKLAA